MKKQLLTFCGILSSTGIKHLVRFHPDIRTQYSPPSYHLPSCPATWPSSTPPSTPPPRSNNYSIPALSLGTCPQHLDIAGTSSTSTCRSICCYGISVGWSGRRSQHAVLMANPRPRGHGTPHTEPGVWGHALFIHSTAAGVFVAGLPRRATKDVLGWRCPTTAAISSLEAAPGCLNG